MKTVTGGLLIQRRTGSDTGQADEGRTYCVCVYCSLVPRPSNWMVYNHFGKTWLCTELCVLCSDIPHLHQFFFYVCIHGLLLSVNINSSQTSFPLLSVHSVKQWELAGMGLGNI